LRMSPENYEALIHQGWRRSGIHIYKPDNWNSCCPALTIRLESTQFIPTKSQKRVVSKLEQALIGSVNENASNKQNQKHPPVKINDDILQQLQNTTYDCLKSGILPCEHASLLQPEFCRYKVKTLSKKKDGAATVVCTVCAALAGRSKGTLQRNVLSRQLVVALKTKSLPFAVSVVSAHEPSGQVLVTLSSHAVVDNHTHNDSMSISSSHPPNPVQEWLQTDMEPPYSLKITTLPAHESSLQPDVHKLYFQYQQSVHGDPNPLNSNAKQQKDVDDDDVEEDWGDATQEYREQCKEMLKREYPNDAETMNAAFSGFYRFLVESPIDYDGTYGTVHQHYRIHDKLIAIGVVDILPHGLSSVYAIYDPSQHITAFGKYLSLKEIQFALPNYYYLGYYIESCPKMRYKAEYKPSELLCPVTYKWVDADKAQETLVKNSPQRHCCTLYKASDDETSNHGNDIYRGQQQQQSSVSSQVVNQLRLDVGANMLVTLSMLHDGGQAVVRPLLQEFVQEMGPELAPRFILKLV